MMVCTEKERWRPFLGYLHRIVVVPPSLVEGNENLARR